MNKSKGRVFLGGTHANSTWRESLMPLLDSNNIDYFNPVVSDWNENAQRREDCEKDDRCNIHLYVITPEQVGWYSFVEMAVSSLSFEKEVIICFLGQYSAHQTKVIEKIELSLSAIICSSLDEIVQTLKETIMKDGPVKEVSLSITKIDNYLKTKQAISLNEKLKQLDYKLEYAYRNIDDNKTVTVRIIDINEEERYPSITVFVDMQGKVSEEIEYYSPFFAEDINGKELELYANSLQKAIEAMHCLKKEIVTLKDLPLI